MQLSSEFGDEKTNTPVGQDEKNHNDRGVCPGEAGHSPARVPMLGVGAVNTELQGWCGRPEPGAARREEGKEAGSVGLGKNGRI